MELHLNIFGHDGDSFGMYCTEVGILEQGLLMRGSGERCVADVVYDVRYLVSGEYGAVRRC